jgi:tetratricopeptide (TPR) repeat protein
VASVQGDFRAAAAALERALAADPDFVPAMINLISARCALGDLASAERTARRALARDSTHPAAHTLFTRVLVATRRYDEALDHAARARDLAASPVQVTVAAGVRIMCLGLTGALETADQIVAEARAHGVAESRVRAMEALLLTLRGDPGAPQRLAQLEAEVGHDPPGLELMVEAAGFLGDGDTAIRLFERIGNNWRWPLSALFRVAPGLRRLRAHPGFAAWMGEHARHIVWPAEAPPLPEEARSWLAEVRVETGLPGSDAKS